jgi:hypothetical protein
MTVDAACLLRSRLAAIAAAADEATLVQLVKFAESLRAAAQHNLEEERLRARFAAAGLWSAWPPHWPPAKENVLEKALSTFPSDLWGHFVAAILHVCPERAIMLGTTSKHAREVLKRLPQRMPVVVRAKNMDKQVLHLTPASDFERSQELFDLLTSMPPSLLTWACIGTLDLRYSGIGNNDAQSPDYNYDDDDNWFRLSKPCPSVVKLARLLDQFPGLIHLDLSCDCDDPRTMFISDSDVEPLAGALARCSALVSLNLRGNGFYDRGVKLLAEALAQLTALRHLNLGDSDVYDNDDVYIGITDESAGMLAKLLELGRFPALAHLDLTKTGIKCQGRTRLREAWGLKGAQGYHRPGDGLLLDHVDQQKPPP